MRLAHLYTHAWRDVTSTWCWHATINGLNTLYKCFVEIPLAVCLRMDWHLFARERRLCLNTLGLLVTESYHCRSIGVWLTGRSRCVSGIVLLCLFVCWWCFKHMHSYCMLYAWLWSWLFCVCVFAADKRQTTAASIHNVNVLTKRATIQHNILLNFYVYACLHLLLQQTGDTACVTLPAEWQGGATTYYSTHFCFAIESYIAGLPIESI